ncbi:hypothetical protein GT346_31310, partial [Streptomyces sp. SID161]|nr:hypothetical protein [Streptomyces sp. SID161]
GDRRHTPEITGTVERITGTPARTVARRARGHDGGFGGRPVAARRNRTTR